jgi:two-component system cell cycle sensor histidine kinase/response regulator CckA
VRRKGRSVGRSSLTCYLAAVAAVAVMAMVRCLLDPILGVHDPFILFLASAFAAAWAGGWKPGCLALALGYLAADYSFVNPRGSFGSLSPEDWVGAVCYVFVGVLGVGQLEAMRRGAADLARANNAGLSKEAAIRRLANIVESSEDAIVGKDLDGVVMDWNRGACKLYGYSAEEAVGKHVSILTPPRLLDEWREVMDKARGGAPVQPFETVRLRKDGTEVEIMLTVSPILDKGRLTGVSTISRDLTYTKRLEAELRQAVKMEAVGRLAGGVAHDFNNLLTVINGYSEHLAVQLAPEDPMRKSLSEIHKAGLRAEKLTRQLLAYSRKQILQPKVLDINALVADARKLLHHMVGEDMAIVMTLDPELERVKVDPTQVEQIVINLGANARDAMPQGGTLTIKTSNIDLDAKYAAGHPGSQPGRYVMLEMADTGCGMDEAAKKHIFEPFFTTKEVGKGTGLGLAMVYGIVKQSNGNIEVESEPGRGTTFRIYLPLVEAGAECGESREEAEPAPAPGGEETVLLVEDDAMVRACTRTLLQRGGYRVLEAGGGEEAVKVSEQTAGSIDLLVTDVVMPKMSGRAVAERLSGSRPAMKVLYMSGYNDDAILRRGVSVDESPFLSKPFTPGALAHKVRDVLDR